MIRRTCISSYRKRKRKVARVGRRVINRERKDTRWKRVNVSDVAGMHAFWVHACVEDGDKLVGARSKERH